MMIISFTCMVEDNCTSAGGGIRSRRREPAMVPQISPPLPLVSFLSAHTHTYTSIILDIIIMTISIFFFHVVHMYTATT